MVDVKRDGRFYIKTTNAVKVPHDGDPYTIFAKLIPPYVSVETAWVHMFYTGAVDSDMWDKQEIMSTMGMTNVDTTGATANIGTTDGVGTGHSDDDQDHLNGYVGGRLPLSAGIYTGTRQDTALDKSGPRLTGGQPLSEWYKDRIIGKEKIHKLGLGRNAIMSGAGVMRYCVDDYWGQTNVSGHTCSITEPRLIALQTATKEAQSETTDDPEYLLTGDNDIEIDRLTSDAWFMFGEGGVNIDEGQDYVETPASIAAGIPSADNTSYQNPYSGVSPLIDQWATKGWAPTTGDTGYDTGVDIVVQANVTLLCRTLKPQRKNIWTPS